MQTSLSLNRIYLIFRRNVLLNTRGTLISIGGVFGLVFFIFLIAAYHNANMQIFHTSVLMSILFIGGMIYASQAFNDFSSKSKGIVYLGLPATRREKVLEALVRTLLVYPVAITAVYYVFSLLLGLLGNLVFSTPFNAYNLFKNIPFDAAFSFLLLHSIFFLGSLYFSRNAFLKTILALFVLNIIFMIVSGLAGYLFFHDIDSMSGDYYFENLFSMFFVKDYHTHGIIIGLVVTAFLWFVAFIRLSEKQI